VLRLIDEGANIAKEVDMTLGEIVMAKNGWDTVQLGEWSRPRG
jgi:hypothetical protein